MQLETQSCLKCNEVSQVVTTDSKPDLNSAMTVQ